MTAPRVCVDCGGRVRANSGRWVHDERHAGTVWARRMDDDHRPVATRGEPAPVTAPTPAPARTARQPKRPIAPIPQPVQWGPPMPFERYPFNPDRARLRGCEAAAGLDVIGEL